MCTIIYVTIIQSSILLQMNRSDYLPLFNAVLHRDVAAVESFLQTPGVDVEFMGVNRYTPLNWAIFLNQKAIVEVLLAHGAAVNGPVGAIKTPLQQVSNSNFDRTAIINLLLGHGADVDAMTADNRMTPLTIACSENSNLGTIQLLRNAGADVNGGGACIAPLHSAAYYGNQGATQLLIEAGADVNRVSTEVYDYLLAGNTPLHSAAVRVHLDCLNILLAAGADPNIVNATGQNPLHCAAWQSVQIVNALLAAGCDPLHRDDRGRTLFNLFLIYIIETSLRTSSTSSLLWWLLEIVRGSACRPLALAWKQQCCLCGRMLLMSCLRC